MADQILELLFKLDTQDDGGLARAEAAIRKISSESGLTGQALANLERNVRKAFESMSASGLNFQQIIRRLAVSGDEIGRGVAGGAKQIEKSLKDAADAAANLEKRQKELQSSASGIKSAISNPLQAVESAATSAAVALGPVGLAILGVSVAATLGAKELFDFVDAQGKAAQQTVNMATRLGLTAGQMKALEVEARTVGVSTQTLSMSARYLSMGLEDSTGSGKRAATALKELGVSMQTASGHAREEGAVLLDTIEALSKVESQTKRTELATMALGRSGSKDIQNLINGYGDLKAVAQELGATDMSGMLEDLEKGEEQINKMRSAWDIFKAKLAEQISPIVIPVVQKITQEITSDHPQLRWWFGGPSATLDNYPINGKPDERITAKDLHGHGFQGDKAGLRLSDQLGAQSLDAGKRVTDQFEANRKNTPEGRSDRLEEISKQLKEIADSFAKGGLGEQAAKTLDTQRKRLESEKLSLQNANSIYTKRESLIRELQANYQETLRHPDRRITDQGGNVGHAVSADDLDSGSQLRKLSAERQRDLDIVGPANTKLVDAKYGPKIQEAIQKLFQDVQKSMAKGLEDADKEKGRNSARTPDEIKEFRKESAGCRRTIEGPVRRSGEARQDLRCERSLGRAAEIQPCYPDVATAKRRRWPS